MPGPSVISHQVHVLFEHWVGQRRHHLTMGVHLDSRALRLLQQLLQIPQIVTGYQNPGARGCIKFYLRKLRISVLPGIGQIQKLHCHQSVLPHCEHQFQKLSGWQPAFIEIRQGCLDEIIYFGDAFSQGSGVIDICRQPLQPEGYQGMQTSVVLCGIAGFLTLLQGLVQTAFAPHHIPQLPGPSLSFTNLPLDCSTVVVDVCNGDKQILRNHAIRFASGVPSLILQPGCYKGKSGGFFKKVILQTGNLIVFAADASYGTACSVGRFLALIAEHPVIPS